MAIRHYAKASDVEYDAFGWDQAQVTIVEEHWSRDNGWEEGGVLSSAEWLSTVDDVTGIRVFEPADAILENMGWQREGNWVDVAYGYVASVKPLALF